MKLRELKSESERKTPSEEQNLAYAAKLSQMINCKTVYTNDGKYRDEFAKFYSVIDSLFPNLVSKAEKLTFGEGCFFYVIKGESAKKNILLMSHHDVVEGGDGWDTDPFNA